MNSSGFNPILPPSDTEAEECIVGMALAFNFLPDLGVKHFYDATMRRLFMAVEQAAMDGRRIDYAGILPYLPAAGKVEDAIRAADVQQAAPYKDNQSYYEGRLKTASDARDALRFGMEIQTRIQGLVREGTIQDASAVMDWIRITAGGLGIDDDEMETSIQAIADRYTAEVLELAEHPELAPGLKTGLPALDALSGGLRPGQLWVICARPSIGKSALAHNIARAASESRVPTTIISAESTQREVYMRALADITGIGSDDWLAWKGRANVTALTQGRDEIKQRTLFIVDRHVRTDADCIREARRYRPRVLIVDYLQMLSSARTERTRVLELGIITKTLKNWAKDSGGTCVLLSQLSRAIENREADKQIPRLSDLRDSGEIEQDADLVVGLARDYLAPGITDGQPQKAKMAVIKNRDGRCGVLDALYFPTRCAWGSISKEEPKGDF